MINDNELLELFTKGYLITQYDIEKSDKILRQMESESWLSLKSEHDVGDNYKNVKNRSISVRSILQPLQRTEADDTFIKDICDYAKPIFDLYEGYDTHLLPSFCAGEGYEMTMHSDIYDRSIISVVAYFGNAIMEEKDGGYLSIAKRQSDGTYAQLERIKPSHGKIVLLCNSNPTIQHSVEKMNATGKNRYCYIGSFGTAENPEWNYKFKCESGFINPRDPVLIFDFQEMRKYIEFDYDPKNHD